MDSVLRDILDEPAVIAGTIAEGRRSLPGLVDRLCELDFDRVYLVGAGSSNFVGLSGRYACDKWARRPAHALPVYDFLDYALQAEGRSLVVAISQSGETAETVAAAEASLRRGLPTVALTNNEGSRLGRLCPEIILTRAGAESGPGTKTVTAEGLAIYQFMLTLARRLQPALQAEIEARLAELDRAAEMAARMLADDAAPGIDRLVEMLAATQGFYLVGAGPFSALAMQGANYLREVGKLPCYPFEACEFRHGPLEALNRDSLLVALSSSTCLGSGQVERACRVAARAGATVFYVGDEAGDIPDLFRERLLLPGADEMLASLLYLVPLHLAGYRLARRKGLDPNRFTNIVKTWVD